MKTRILISLSWIILCLPVPGAVHDTSEVSGLFYLDGESITICIAGDRIVKIDRSVSIDTPSFYIAPGLIDIQINGYLGVDFSDQHLTPEGMRKAIKGLYKEGVTSILPTVITNHPDSLVRSFTLLAAARQEEDIGLSVPGFHLEGPYISPLPGYRGAHLEKYVRPPDWNEFSVLQEAAGSRIRVITLAPEIPGALDFIPRCKEAGIVVSLGHHNGSADIIKKAVDAGATLSTHLGNGCANLINRHDNPLWPQLAEDRLTVTLIADGFHLNPDEVICFYRIKGAERTVLVSDALDLAGLPPGEYTRGERKVVVTPGVVKYPAENVLAGAVSPLTTGISNMMKFTGCGLAQAIRMASTNPARLLGLQDRGEVVTGKRADLILFTIEAGTIIIQQTIVAGKTVYLKSASNQSPVTIHHSPVTIHQSPVTSHQSPVTSHQSPVTIHHAP
jgi:N-acetylglucosamine-6-phosphate deacetylase